MFIRYMHSKCAVNLDNFDYICVRSYACNKFRVLACRVQPGIKSISRGYGGGTSFDTPNAHANYVIQTFDNKAAAFSFYESLQYAWINGRQKIFEVED